MRIDTIFKLKENKLYLEYLHHNSNWYKILNRNPDKFNEFVNQVKIYYKLRPIDKVNNIIDTFDTMSNIISALNSN